MSDPSETIICTSSTSKICRSTFVGLVWVALSVMVFAKPGLTSDYQPDADGLVTSDDGTINLAWSEDSSSSNHHYLLEQSRRLDFQDARRRYLGPDTASVLTGLREGSYYFRVRRIDPDGQQGDWSSPLALKVQYLDRPTLFLLLSVGAIVAGSTIFTITLGFFKNR